MANDERSTVVGVFEDRSMAERAVEELKNSGFEDDQIGFAVHDDQNAAGTETADQQTHTTEGGAITGAVSGGILGGIVGAAAALLIPGVGPVIAGGILGATLLGAGVGAAAGGLLGGLTKLGVPEEEARFYDQEFQAGRSIVTVQTPDRQQDAIDILRRNGAYDASTRPAGAAYGTSNDQAGYMPQEDTTMAQQNRQFNNYQNSGNWQDVAPQYQSTWQQRYGNQGGNWQEYEPVYRYGWEMRNNPQYSGRSWSEVEPQLRSDWESRNYNMSWDQASPYLQESWDTSGWQDMGDQTQRAVPIREEQLQATKQPVQTGEVRIGKDVVTEERTINVPVTREQVYVEQQNFAPRPADQPIQDDGETIRVPVIEEQVQVQKVPVQTGEVRIGKEQMQENKQVSDTIRREEAHLEQQGDVDVQGSGVEGNFDTQRRDYNQNQ